MADDNFNMNIENPEVNKEGGDQEVNKEGGDKSVDGVSEIVENQELAVNNEENQNNNNLGEIKEGQNLALEELEKKPLEEIIKLLHHTVVPVEEVNPSFSKVLIQNNMFKFYMAKNNTFGVCSLMVINNITLRKKEFIKILKMFESIKDIDSNNLLKLKGATVIDDNTCYLLFDPLMNCFTKKAKDGQKLGDNEKFALLFYIIEMLSKLHDLKISFEDCKLDNVLYNAYDEFKYIIPMRKSLNFN